jgi:hypothetical protein
MRGNLAVAAAVLSAGAAAIHASVAAPHFDDYAPYGVLFALTAVAQAVWAAVLLLAPSIPVFAAGIGGNAGIVVVWALSRTTGLPFGPDAWSPEPVGRLDVSTTAFELGVVVLSGLSLAARGGDRPPARADSRFAAVAAALVAALASLAFGGAEGSHRHGSGVGEAHRHGGVPTAAKNTSRPPSRPDAAGLRRQSVTPARRATPAQRAGATDAPHAHAHAHAPGSSP